MNEFISQEKKYEIINQVLQFLDSDKPINDISEFLEDEIRNINKNHKDIGLKDINGKNIYADSSIFEFEYSVGLWEYKKAIGVFFWDTMNLKYRLNIIEKNNTYGKVIWNFELKENRNFKIIDTIQENKLGLIK